MKTKSLCAITLMVLSGLALQAHANDVSSTDDASKKTCVIDLVGNDGDLALQQREEANGIAVEFVYSTVGESSNRLSPELDKTVTAYSSKSLIASQVDMKTLIESKDLKPILEELLKNTGYGKGEFWSRAMSIDAIISKIRSKCN